MQDYSHYLVFLAIHCQNSPFKNHQKDLDGNMDINKHSDHTLVPLPLEHLIAPAELTGEHGSNRAASFVNKQIDANNDLQAIQTWLAEFEHSPQTQRSYRKESERLLLWSLIERRKPLSSLTRDDLRAYQMFLANPQPTSHWCGKRKRRSDSQWRPFQGPLGEQSIAQAITIVNALFSYLVEAGYLSGNPLGLMRRKIKQRTTNKDLLAERFLEKNLWQTVINYIESLAKETQRDQKNYERIRFLFHLLYLLGPRVSEVAKAKMSDIKQIRGRWWWQVMGKGQKIQLIPVNDDMLNALIRYRQFYGLSALPRPDKTDALFMSLNGTKNINANMIYRLVKKVFFDCANSIEKERPDFANKLKQASTHWVRHTSITHQTDVGIELRYIKRSARHESVETTMLYQHAEEENWHNAMGLHRMPENNV